MRTLRTIINITLLAVGAYVTILYGYDAALMTGYVMNLITERPMVSDHRIAIALFTTTAAFMSLVYDCLTALYRSVFPVSANRL
jgi:energy-converting hydrogenase Eha subunit A